MNQRAYGLGVLMIFAVNVAAIALRAYAEAAFLASYGAQWIPILLVSQAVAFAIGTLAYDAATGRAPSAAVDVAVGVVAQPPGRHHQHHVAAVLAGRDRRAGGDLARPDPGRQRDQRRRRHLREHRRPGQRPRAPEQLHLLLGQDLLLVAHDRALVGAAPSPKLPVGAAGAAAVRSRAKPAKPWSLVWASSAVSSSAAAASTPSVAAAISGPMPSPSISVTVGRAEKVMREVYHRRRVATCTAPS